MASTVMEKRKSFPTALPQEQRDNVLALIEAHPNAKDGELASVAGVSRSVVSRLRIGLTKKQVGPDNELEEYGRRIAKRLPVRERVKVLTEIVREAKQNPFVRLRAIEVANELAGIVTRKQQREADNAQAMPQPIFVLPPGASLVSVSAPVAIVPAKPEPTSE